MFNFNAKLTVSELPMISGLRCLTHMSKFGIAACGESSTLMCASDIAEASPAKKQKLGNPCWSFWNLFLKHSVNYTGEFTLSRKICILFYVRELIVLFAKN
jgi:hypothetical protein